MTRVKNGAKSGKIIPPTSPSPRRRPSLWALPPACASADDVNKVKTLLESKGKLEDPEFFPEPSCPFYTYQLGALSPYGERHWPAQRQALSVLAGQ